MYQDDFWLRTPLLDDQIFFSWAETIRKEGWLAPSLGIFDLNPAYPYLLSMLQRVLGTSILAVYALQHLLGAAAAVLFYRLTRELFGMRAGLCAGVFGILYGPSFFYESRLLGEFWIYLFNLAALCSLLYARLGERKLLGWYLGGLFLGLSTVLRPNVLVFLPFVGIWGAWTMRSEPRRLVFAALLFAVGVWLPLLPFQFRNHMIDPDRGWGLTTSSGGVNLYLGNNPEADGLNKPPSFIRYGPGHEYEDFKIEADKRTGRNLDRKEVSRYWTGQTLKWFSRRPDAAFRLLLRKAGFFWNHREPPDNFFPSIFRRFTALGWLPLISWGILAPLGLAGFLWSLGAVETRRFWVLHAYVLAYFAVNAAFYILSRYRFPAAAGLIPFAAFGLVRLLDAWRAKSRGAAAGLTALLLLCAGLTRLPLIGEEDLAVSHYSMGVVYANQGWKEKAVKEYQASIAYDADFKASYLNLGILQAKQGRFPEALKALEGALRLESDPQKAALIKQNVDKLRAQLGR